MLVCVGADFRALAALLLRVSRKAANLCHLLASLTSDLAQRSISLSVAFLPRKIVAVATMSLLWSRPSRWPVSSRALFFCLVLIFLADTIAYVLPLLRTLETLPRSPPQKVRLNMATPIQRPQKTALRSCFGAGRKPIDLFPQYYLFFSVLARSCRQMEGNCLPMTRGRIKYDNNGLHHFVICLMQVYDEAARARLSKIFQTPGRPVCCILFEGKAIYVHSISYPFRPGYPPRSPRISTLPTSAPRASIRRFSSVLVSSFIPAFLRRRGGTTANPPPSIRPSTSPPPSSPPSLDASRQPTTPHDLQWAAFAGPSDSPTRLRKRDLAIGGVFSVLATVAAVSVPLGYGGVVNVLLLPTETPLLERKMAFAKVRMLDSLFGGGDPPKAWLRRGYRGRKWCWESSAPVVVKQASSIRLGLTHSCHGAGILLGL